ncbi:MAG TPA: nucleotidyltransferase family protein [Gammaproteobacteria bacterium]|nr:nucleotidyltransferase family protein [Gammaproteobacteria bacterium]
MKNWEKLLIQKKTKIKSVLKLFERNNAQIAFIIENDILIGTITDGDVRRSLLGNLSLEVCAETIMNRSPIVIPYDSSESDIKLKLKQHCIKYIPLVDHKGRISSVYSNQDFEKFKEISNPVVLMAGGEGKRLRPLTNTIPKPMVDLNGTPIIEKAIVELISYGFRNFYISINYLGNIVKDHFGDGEKWGVSINYLEEHEKLGTAGSLSLLQDVKEDFFVINGDLVTNINFKSMLDHHIAEKTLATIALKRASFKVPYGVVLNNSGKVISIEEKPIVNYNINCGIYILSSSILSRIEQYKRSLDMPTLLRDIIEKNDTVSAFSIYENWYDIADINDLEKVRDAIL